MSNALPKWTDERTAQLTALAGSGTVSQATVASAATALETTPRSVASKLRKLGYDVATVSADTVKTFTDSEAEALVALVTSNSGSFTYGELAAQFAGGKFTARQVQGKILSLELTSHVKETPKVVEAKKYSEEEEAKFVKLVNKGVSLEVLAEKMGRDLNSVRGKALSLLRAGSITAIPKQEHVKAPEVDALEALGDVSGLTVDAIAEKIGKTPRGVKTMLTRRGLNAADYKAKTEKAE